MRSEIFGFMPPRQPMKDTRFDKLRAEIAAHESNAHYTAQGFMPLFDASTQSRIIIVGQAPGVRAQASGLPWNDASGERLMRWIGVSEAQFRDNTLFAHMPMDFYYPGKAKTGDLPPRKTFADLWHHRLKDLLPDVQLTILIGRYAQQYYLPNNAHRTVTATVRHYQDFLPEYFPLVHPSPLNFRWFARNEWFEAELIPNLQKTITTILSA